MSDRSDESLFSEAEITDIEAARAALSRARDTIRALREDALRAERILLDKTAKNSFLENQLKCKNSEIENILRSNEEETASRHDSLQLQFRSKLERLTEREKELEDKISRQEDNFKQKERKLREDYNDKSEELHERRTRIEGELWKLRQEQLTRQQQFEELYAAKLEEERVRAAAEIENARAGFAKTSAGRLSELEKRENYAADELKKQEAVLKWARDSFQAETEELEKSLKRKELDIDKKLTEKDREIEIYKVQVDLLQKQLSALPEAARLRDTDLDRYRKAMESLESVISALEAEKKSLQADSSEKISSLNKSLEAEKNRRIEIEAEIPGRLRMAVDQERGLLAEKLSAEKNGFNESLRERQEKIDYLERNLKISEERSVTLQAERDSFSRQVQSLQAQYNAKLEEFSFRDKQLQSEYDVRVKVEIDKKTSALRNELDSSCRIYEDNLRLKVEEISHLRRELEAAVSDKMSFQTQAAEARRMTDAVQAKAETEQTALKAQLKSAYEAQLSEELAAAGILQAGEKKKVADDFEARLKDFRLEVSQKEDDIQRLRAEITRLGEEKQSSLEEERRRGKAGLEAQAASFSDTVKIYEDKIVNLNKAIESVQAEREELILLERGRLERLYAEKEKDFDERLAGKDREAARAAELAAQKNREIDSLRLAKEAQEDAHRKALEALGSRLTEAVVKLESCEAGRAGLKKTE